MRKTNTIAVLTSFLNSSSLFEVYLMNGFEKANFEAGNKYAVYQYSTRGDVSRKSEILQWIVKSAMADGVLSLFLHLEKQDVDFLATNHIPIVFVDEVQEGASTVKSDNLKGTMMAVEHLVRTGRKNIAYIGGRFGHEGVGIVPQERFDMYRKTILDSGLKYEENMSFFTVHYSPDEGKQAFYEFKDRGLKYDAVFCAAGDIVAVAFMEEAQRHGVRFPEDVAMVGYDDAPVAAFCHPKLTTVRQPIEEMGRQAFKLLEEAIEGELRKPEIRVFAPELIIRESA